MMASDPGTFVCGECGGLFDKGWSDVEAQAEMLANFGDLLEDDQVVICDPCFQEMEQRMRAAGLDFGDVTSTEDVVAAIRAEIDAMRERERARILAEHGEVGLYIHDQIEAKIQKATSDLLLYGYVQP